MSDDYNYLCFACGNISAFSHWTLLQRDIETGLLRLSRWGESDPICVCPVCEWQHTDDDGNPGILDGPETTLAAEREKQKSIWADLWDDRRIHVTDVAVRRLMKAACSRTYTVQCTYRNGNMEDVTSYEIIHAEGRLHARVNLTPDGSLSTGFPA